MNKSKFLLVDGNFLMFQSFYASYNPYTMNSLMKSPEGIYTNGVHVFLLSLTKLIDFIKPDYLFVAFDAQGKTKRHENYEGYKAGRTKAPEIIFEQFNLIKQILTGLNVKWFEQIGDEADDLIATLAQNKNTENYIFSKDKDLLQLVNENTSVISHNKKTGEFELINLDNFKNLIGILPYQIPDFKGLAGDSSDNLKGVEGIGEKTAIKLLNEYETLENLYNSIDLIKGKTKEKLLLDKESAFFCKSLAILNRNVQMDKEILKYANFIYFNNADGKELLKKHNLKVAYNFLFKVNI
ncbi:5'-3' exonuclease [Mycoplasmopsis gallinarum]|uniref:5'-3' exonuclease n=1 Tax=Mycoplasmopsis gallinarum TaxID=29557 RepID=UPI00055EBD37|nr:5'-3' exonuclease [Mycoplasmopsis gallinarum]